MHGKVKENHAELTFLHCVCHYVNRFLIHCFCQTRVRSLATLVTYSLTDSCEDSNSKFVEVVTVADVYAGKRVDDSLVQIWKLKFGQKANFLFRL